MPNTSLSVNRHGYARLRRYTTCDSSVVRACPRTEWTHVKDDTNTEDASDSEDDAESRTQWVAPSASDNGDVATLDMPTSASYPVDSYAQSPEALPNWMQHVYTWAFHMADQNHTSFRLKENMFRTLMHIYSDDVGRFPETYWMSLYDKLGFSAAFEYAVHISPISFGRFPAPVKQDKAIAQWALTLDPAHNIDHIIFEMLKDPELMLYAAMKNLDVLFHTQRVCAAAVRLGDDTIVREIDAVMDVVTDPAFLLHIVMRHKRQACLMMLQCPWAHRFVGAISKNADLERLVLQRAPDEYYSAYGEDRRDILPRLLVDAFGPDLGMASPSVEHGNHAENDAKCQRLLAYTNRALEWYYPDPRNTAEETRVKNYESSGQTGALITEWGVPAAVYAPPPRRANAYQPTHTPFQNRLPMPFVRQPTPEYPLYVKQWIHWIYAWAHYEADARCSGARRKQMELQKLLLVFRDQVQHLGAEEWVDIRINTLVHEVFPFAVQIAPWTYVQLPPDVRADRDVAFSALVLHPARNVRHIPHELLTDTEDEFLCYAAGRNSDVLAHVQYACADDFNENRELVRKLKKICTSPGFLTHFVGRHKRGGCIALMQCRWTHAFVSSIRSAPRLEGLVLRYAPDEYIRALELADRLTLLRGYENRIRAMQQPVVHNVMKTQARRPQRRTTQGRAAKLSYPPVQDAIAMGFF